MSQRKIMLYLKNPKDQTTTVEIVEEGQLTRDETEHLRKLDKLKSIQASQNYFVKTEEWPCAPEALAYSAFLACLTANPALLLTLPFTEFMARIVRSEKFESNKAQEFKLLSEVTGIKALRVKGQDLLGVFKDFDDITKFNNVNPLTPPPTLTMRK